MACMQLQRLLPDCRFSLRGPFWHPKMWGGPSLACQSCAENCFSCVQRPGTGRPETEQGNVRSFRQQGSSFPTGAPWAKSQISRSRLSIRCASSRHLAWCRVPSSKNIPPCREFTVCIIAASASTRTAAVAAVAAFSRTWEGELK